MEKKEKQDTIPKTFLYPLSYFYKPVVWLSDNIVNIALSLYCYKSIKPFLCSDLTNGIWKLYKQKTAFPHPIGIVIGKGVKMGQHCKIYQNVTIGTKDTTVDYRLASYPTLGNHVTIFPNAVLIGNIKIGNHAVIGAGAIVLSDVPENGVAVGNLARILT